ncbi:MAG: ABC transporter substrate-binding protein [Candidatus Eremiobacteraeota bacterium]|nr:ABC transporter substrate-binding protein [Candidatus Eremiobacteraeota bacterium]
MRLSSTFVALALTAVTLAGCTSSTQTSSQPGASTGNAGNGKPTYGGTLKIGSYITADTIVPIYAHSEGSQNILGFLYDALVNVDPDFHVVPWLAKSWELSKDGRTYTFYLRHDATWSDGVPITSADVKFEYDLTTNPASGASYRGDYDVVQSVRTPDKWTVVYALKEPNAPFLAAVLGGPFSPHCPLPVHVYGKIPPGQLQHMDLSKHLVTSGPYSLAEWKHDDHFLLSSNKRWWKGRPYIDSVYVKEYQNEPAVQIALQNGDIDTSFALPSTTWLRLKDDARFVGIHNPSDQFNMYAINMRNPILADINVRKAVMYAYDRKTEAEKLFHNEDIPTFSPIPMAIRWAYDPSTEKAYAFDPQKAAKLLDDDGWKTGSDGYRHKAGKLLAFTTSLIAGSDVSTKSFELFQADLKNVGIKTSARAYEFNVFFNNEQKGDFDVGAGGFGGAADPDPFQLLSSKAWAPNGLNYGQYSNAQMDDLINQGRRISDPAKRKALYLKLQQLVVDQVPEFFDVAPYYRVFINKRILGVNPSHGGSQFSATMYDEPSWYIAQ